MHETATGEMPFALAFRHEAVIVVEIGIGTHKIKYFNEECNNE